MVVFASVDYEHLSFLTIYLKAKVVTLLLKTRDDLINSKIQIDGIIRFNKNCTVVGVFD